MAVKVTEENKESILRFLIKAKKPKEKAVSRMDFLNEDKAFQQAILELKQRGFTVKQIVETIKEASEESNMLEVLKYSEKEIRALLLRISDEKTENITSDATVHTSSEADTSEIGRSESEQAWN